MQDTSYRARSTLMAQLFSFLVLATSPWPAMANQDQIRTARYQLDHTTLLKFENALDRLILVFERLPVGSHRPPMERDLGIVELATFFDSNSLLREAILGAGLTPYNFTVFMWTWTKASEVSCRTQSLPTAQRAQAILGSGLSIRNVEFVSSHAVSAKDLAKKIRAIKPMGYQTEIHIKTRVHAVLCLSSFPNQSTTLPRSSQ